MSDSRWITASPPPNYDVGAVSSSTALRPYLQLPHLLSLTWLAYPILSLLFIAFRLQLSSDAAQSAIVNAKGDLQTACKAAEQAATAAASMPRYMAIASNEQIADAVNGSMNAARATLVLALTVMEAIINFIVDIYRSTFLCFLELVVRGGLSILIGALQEFNSFIQSTASSIRTNIQNDIATANSAIQSAVSALNKVNPFGDIKVPQFSIPSLSGLDNITLPTDFQDALTKLNASLPSVSDLKDKVNAVLDTPFELVKQDINDTFAGISFNSSVLPVPQQNALAFCGDLDTSVVDDLGLDLLKIARIGIILMVVLAFILIGLNCLLEWYKWRCLQRHLQYTREAWLSDPTLYNSSPAMSSLPSVTLTNHNLLMLQANSAHPLLTRIANTLSQKLRFSPTQHINTQWFLHYIFHPPALACLLIGLFGLLTIELQLLAVSPLEAKFADRTNTAVSDFSNVIATSVNNSMYNQSSAYANDINGRVDVIQSTINDGLFGWVNGTTTTLNNTVVAFYDDIQNAVSTVFNGTILESPAQEFIRCFIGSKVDAIETALTFLHDNLKIDIPRVNQNVLVLSQDSINEAAKPIAAAAIGGGQNDNQGLVGRLVNNYVESLKKERLMFGIFIGLWILVVLMGISIVLWHSYGKGWIEERRGRKWRQQTDAINGSVVQFRAMANEKGGSDLDLGGRNLQKDMSVVPEADMSNEGSVYGGRISRPVKLQAIGKAAGQEQSEDERARDTDVDGLYKRATLINKVKGIFVKRKAVPVDSAVDLPTSVDRTNLQVSTDLEPEVPQSRWSLSPEVPIQPKPWSERITPPKKRSSSSFPAASRKLANVPSDVDVDSVYDRTSYISGHPPLKPSLLAPHQAFPRSGSPPPPEDSPPYINALSPPRPKSQQYRHRRSVSVPQAPSGSRNLIRSHTRPTSGVHDPFATPFDDEYAAVPASRRSIKANPFIAL